jgi:RNA polymerase sigma factor for flagellar operon FliA
MHAALTSAPSVPFVALIDAPREPLRAGEPPVSVDVEAHLPLVWRVARQMARRLPSTIAAEELVGAGTLGLIGALSRYESARCDRFSAYAEFRIRGAILDQLREMDWMPRSLRTKRKRLDAANAQLAQALGRAPDAGELATALGTTSELVERMRRDVEAADVVCTDAVNADVIVDDEGATPGSLLEDRELRARLARALDLLPERQQQVVRMYYVDQMRLREIGQLLCVTESRVCQILRDAVGRLRAELVDD